MVLVLPTIKLSARSKKQGFFLNGACIEVRREGGELEKPLSSIIVDFSGSTILQNKNSTMDPTFLFMSLSPTDIIAWLQGNMSLIHSRLEIALG